MNVFILNVAYLNNIKISDILHSVILLFEYFNLCSTVRKANKMRSLLSNLWFLDVDS
jgi:hypothetical protein